MTIAYDAVNLQLSDNNIDDNDDMVTGRLDIPLHLLIVWSPMPDSSF